VNVSKLAPYAKTLVAILGVVGIIARAAVDGVITSDELSSIGIALLTAAGVYQVRNKVQ
jgi:hypothetical protein